MVDFKKKLGITSVTKKTNPLELYESLDRRSELGPLRPSQISILDNWYNNRKDDKNLIIKLHTGEGKTLIGLLLLQSKINSGDGSCLYICPNIYLYEQTCLEAKKFGIPFCTIENREIPDAFLVGSKILITYVQKVFHGLTIFGIDTSSIPVNNVVLDDSHACIDSIKDTFTIKIKKEHSLYSDLMTIFEEDLIFQGEGSFIEICDGEYNTLLPIPYWSWIDKKSDALSAISKYKTDDSIKFTWPIIKDCLEKCQAYISGNEIEISPTFIPIHKFGSFHNAKQRVLMSATTQEDSFFIKGLGFDIAAVQNPLNISDVKWSGEKMILLPSLIDNELDRDLIITNFAQRRDNREYGIVSIIPDFKKAHQYDILGAQIVDKKNIFEVIRNLKDKKFNKTIVIANRYDGIDLPDETCRILIIDSKPFFNSLNDRYEENCRTSSDIINIKIAQKIEQGIGRSVRGEKDYSIIIMIGSDLIKFLKSQLTNKFFSNQTKKQIEIGLKVAEFAKEEIRSDESKMRIINSLIHQVLHRDEGWKEFYREEMEKIESKENEKNIYDILTLEREAEELLFNNDFEKAILKMQKLCDKFNTNISEKGWYLQSLARFKYFVSKLDSNNVQQSAFQNNRYLLKPKDGITYKKLEYINENRIKRITEWIKQFSTFEELSISVDSILDDFSFGIEAEKFEAALKTIGEMLGFLSERPDREIKKGPDNLWCGVNNKYLFFECKSEVKDDRSEITKTEAGQMNSHCGWFEEEYGKEVSVKRILIIPTKKLTYYANFTHDVKIMRKNKLRELKTNIKGFIKEFKNYKIDELSDEKLQEFINCHKLDIDSLHNDYHEEVSK